jgi:hypothetical protein
MLSESFRTVDQFHDGLIHQSWPGLRTSERPRKCANFWALQRAQSDPENSFMEMTKKMMHVCENYGNCFLYIRTAINPVVFVEFLRG